MTEPLPSSLAGMLVCPRDRSPVKLAHERSLECEQGHEYPVVDGVPIMLVGDVVQTIGVAHDSLDQARQWDGGSAKDEWFANSLGLSDSERRDMIRLAGDGRSPIDPAVAYLIAATNGLAYRHMVGKLREYPIPELRLPPGDGRTLLDIGCNWGRWSLAAARLGYRPIGIDPSLGAVMAARRVARALRLDVRHIVGDARCLPLAAASVDVVFSYSVLQHLSRPDASMAIAEAGRVLRPGGASLIQMPTKWGVRCLYHQARRKFREATEFEVRYWTIGALRRLFTTQIGPTRTSVDCFFGIGLQASDRHLMPITHRLAISASEALRSASRLLPPLTYLADSVYLASVKPRPGV
jgi:SAM-dependent methyltransferase/uncharacterized protein YbaR (Trm112 family)